MIIYFKDGRTEDFNDNIYMKPEVLSGTYPTAIRVKPNNERYPIFIFNFDAIEEISY